MKFKILATLAFVIIIQNSFAQNVGIGTTTPQARLHVADSNVYFSSPSSDPVGGFTPTENGGYGLLWIAGKGALRVGRETEDRWAYNNIGGYSASFGFNNSVTGVGGFASGNYNRVTGLYGTALGGINHARDKGAVAIGYLSEGLGDYTNAFGYGVVAQSFQSTALGRFNNYSGNSTTDYLNQPILVVGNGTSDINRRNALSILKDGRIMVASDSLTNYQFYVKAKTVGNAVFAQSDAAQPYSVAIYATNGSASGHGILGVATGAGLGTVVSPTYSLNAVSGYGYGSATAVAATSASGIGIDAKSISGYAILSSGKIKFRNLGEGAGKILVSDAVGEATWQNPSTLTLDQSSATGISQFEFRNNGAYRGAFGWSQADGRFFFYDGESGTNTMFINNGRMGIRRDATTNALEVGGEASKSTAGSWLGNSDARLKKNIVPVTNALDKLLHLKGVQYEWNDNQTGYPRPAGIQMGFTAQNVQQVFPEKVSTDAQGFLQTAYGTYDPLIVEAIRELKNENDVLKKEIAEIKKLLEKK